MLIECLASRSEIKHRYGSHRQQPQNDNRSDVLDPFLIVREPSMMHVHGQPPSGYPCCKLTYHIYGSMTELEPVAYLCKRQSCRNAMNRNDYSNLWATGHQPQDSERARAQNPADATRPRRRGDRMNFSPTYGTQ